MAVLYLTEERGWITREGECLIVRIPEELDGPNARGKRERKLTVPLIKVEEVMVIGDATISTPAISSLLKEHIPITYLTRHGRYLGTTFPVHTKNSLLRIAQHQAHHNLGKRHKIARQCVTGKLRNMRTILMRYHRAHPDPVLEMHIERLKKSFQAAEETEPTDIMQEISEIEPQMEMDVEERELGRMNGLGTLLGCEGAGSAAYFQVFERLIKCHWSHGFVKRTRRPPTDPVNAMLSYGYAILTSQVASAVASVGLDPYIGYLHASRHGKPALALDLMEEFRPIIVDSVVLHLLNNHQLEGKHFTTELNACTMNDISKKLFLQRFEERMQETIKHPIFDYKVSYRRCIELQARLLGKYLTGEIETYPPFSVR